MRLRPRRLLLSASLLAIFFANELNAQTTTSGELTGVVTDPSHAVVPDASVEIKDNTKGTTQSAKTDREGVYRFFFLAPSNYVLTVTHPGFRKQSRAVNVLLGPPGTVNVTLEIAKASSEITVTGEAPLLNAENGDGSATVNQQQISEVPNPGNDLTYIAQTTPGAIMNTEYGFGNFSILGMPGTANLFTVNGMYDNDNSANINLSGAANLMLGQNAIQEATVVTNGYLGQFGGAAGANINYITKSGSNIFHGNLAYFWNGRALNANNWFNNALGTPRPFVNANQWAGSLGGPIKNNKLFFFVNAEGVRVFLPYPVPVLLPSPQFEAATITNIDSIFGSTSAPDAFYKQIFSLYNNTPGASAAMPRDFSGSLGCDGFVGPNGLGTSEPCAVHFQKTIGQPQYDSLVSGRVDWNFRSNDRAFLLVQYDHGLNASYTDAISPSLFNVTSPSSIWQGQLNETHTLGPTAANQLLLAAWYVRATWSTANPAKTLTSFPTTLNFNSAGNAFSALGGAEAFLPSPFYASSLKYQMADDFVRTRGEHKLGFGGIFVRTDNIYAQYNTNEVGVLSPQSLDAFYYGGVDPSSKTDFTNLFQSFPVETSQGILNYSLDLYAQDEWRARSNLALTFGLRAEHPSNPVCSGSCFVKFTGPFESISHDPNQPYKQALIQNQKQALKHTDSLQWAPRFGFAWQPLGVSHNLVLRGGIGVFYDPVPTGIAYNLSSNPPLLNSFNVFGYSLTPGESNSLFQNAAASNAAFVNGFKTGESFAQIQKDDAFFLPPGISVADKTMHSPQYQKWNLQLQQTLGASTSLSLGYFGNHGIHELAQNPNANAFGFGAFPAQPCSSPPVPPCADPRFSEVTEYTTPAVSNYNGMVVSFEQRFSRWGQGLFQVNYTYGHALDEVSNGGLYQFTFGSSIYPQDPTNLRSSYGSADYDARHSVNANYVWQVPFKAMLRGHGPKFLVEAWQVSGTVFARTAFPYTAIDYAETGNLAPNNFFGTVYAVPVGPLGSQASCGEGAAIPAAPHPCQPPQVSVLADGTTVPNLNALFVQSECETGFNTGTLPGARGPCSGRAVSFAQGRNRLRGTHYINTNFTVLKNTKIPGWENAELGIGFQFFNLFNHPNFARPDNALSDGTFGQITYMAQPPTSILGGGDSSARMIQLKAQIRF